MMSLVRERVRDTSWRRANRSCCCWSKKAFICASCAPRQAGFSSSEPRLPLRTGDHSSQRSAGVET
jgi:hypothetical protein